MNKDQYKKVLAHCGTKPEVRNYIYNNYWDNKWWPRCVKDWRIKIILVGINTRITEQAINKVWPPLRDYLIELGIEDLKKLSKKDFLIRFKPLGLGRMRWKFTQSVLDFVEKYPEYDNFKNLDHDTFINLLKEEIWGCGWNIAQCAALYISGYNCGIIPVDAGMKDKLAPHFLFNTSTTNKGYEELRKELEHLTAQINFKDFLREIEQKEISNGLKPGEPDYWWTHLALISYKRNYLN